MVLTTLNKFPFLFCKKYYLAKSVLKGLFLFWEKIEQYLCIKFTILKKNIFSFETVSLNSQSSYNKEVFSPDEPILN